MNRPWLLSIFLSGVLCPAQDGGLPTYAVHGTIVNAQTNQPIGRAEVIFDQEYAVLTDSEGRFEFDQIPPGDYQVSVQKPGFISVGNLTSINFGQHFLARPAPPRHIRVGRNMPELTFPLVPCGSIRGQVSLSTSDPADGIRVSAYQRILRNGHPHWQMAGGASTDSEGGFYLGDLAPGKYMLFTEPSLNRPLTAQGAVTWGYPGSYYPGVADSASAGVMTIIAGQTVEADFALTRQAFFPVTVQVRNLDPGAHAGFQILDTLGRTTGLPARYDARDQIVRANVPNGSWILQALSGGPNRLFGRATFQVAGGPVNLGITILPAPKLSVTIRGDFTSTTTDGRPNPPQLVHLGSAVNLQLENLEPFSRGGMTHIEFEPNSDPSSATTHGSIGATPGRYWVEAMTWNSAYVSSITSGGVDLATNPLVIAENNSSSPVEVVLRNDFGTIDGQIARQPGDAPAIAPQLQVGEIPPIYVYAIPLFQTAAAALATGWVTEGQFTLPNLAPGPYRVIACDSEQEIDFHTPEGLAAWEGKGRLVTVNPGATASVQVDVLHAELP